MTPNQIKLTVLQELDNLLSGTEKIILADDDPSGCFTEYVLDTEKFRDKLQNRIFELENEINHDPS